jgi:CubicO group peptidase (beta-lactamase class C family)
VLADEGRLSFSDPVEKYLPEFRALWQVTEDTPERRVLVKGSRPITLFDLLTHTSGMRGYPVTSPHWTLAEMSKVASKEPLRFPPGSHWGYSTAAIDVLGRVVEVVSGQPFAEFMQRRIFDVLEMKETTFWLSREQAARFAENYKKNAAGKLEPVKISYLYGGEPTDRQRPALGGAGLFSTAEDVSHFYQMMLGGGEWRGKRLLRSETVAAMTRNQTGALVVRPGLAVGLGFTVVEIPARMAQNATLSAGTFGHGGAHGTQSWADPVRGIIHVFLIQRAGLPDNAEVLIAYRQALAASLDSAGILVRESLAR